MQVLACLMSSAGEIRTPMLVLPLVPASRSITVPRKPTATCRAVAGLGCAIRRFLAGFVGAPRHRQLTTKSANKTPPKSSEVHRWVPVFYVQGCPKAGAKPKVAETKISTFSDTSPRVRETSL